jgi:hypothetical protein
VDEFLADLVGKSKRNLKRPKEADKGDCDMHHGWELIAKDEMTLDKIDEQIYVRT